MRTWTSEELRPRAAGDLEHLLAEQWGLLTRAQARGVGMSDAAIRWRLSRDWVSVLPGVMHIHRVRLSAGQRLLAAHLYAGPASVITGADATRWYGLEHAQPGGAVRVLVPPGAHSRRMRWVELRRTTLDPGRHCRGPLPVAHLPRAVIDAAREATGVEEATAIVIEAVQRRLTTLEELAHVNDSLGRRGSLLATKALEAAGAGAWSVPEAGLGSLVARSRVLPPMWANPDLYDADGSRLLTPDGWFDDVALALMVHSRRFHDGAQFTGTMERDGELVSHGVIVLPLTPAAIRSHPARVLERIEGAYRAARGRARPPVRARRWDPWGAQLLG